MPKLKGLLDSAKRKLGGLLGGLNEYNDAFNDRAYSLLGNAPQQFNAGAAAGTAGSLGDAAYIARLPEYMLKGSMPDPRTIPGTSDYIAAQAGVPAPEGFLENAAWIGGQLLAPGPGELGAAGMAGGKLAMFLGAKAKTALPDVLEYAQAMDKAGKSADEIWQTTGKLGQPWFKGADGKWRFEIPDNKAMFRGTWPTDQKLAADAVHHPALVDGYPDINGIIVKDTGGTGGTGGLYRTGNPLWDETIEIGGPRGTGTTTMLHELQHAVQQREGFAKGGSPDDFIASNGTISGKVLSDEAKRLGLASEHEGYKRLAGEAEARNVQSRMNMTMDERIALPPWVTQDVPTDQQIVRFGDGPAMAEDFAARRAGKAKPYREAMGLPMDEASRMQRAGEMGFDTPAVHWSRHGVDVSELDSGKFAIAPFDAIGTHTGTPEAAMKRFEGWSSPERGAGVTYPVLIKNQKPYLDPEGKPWNEQKLTEHLREIGGYDSERADYKTLNAKLREKIFSEYDSIPYINDVEDAGSISYITPPQNIRSRWAAFDPKNKDSANLLAGTTAAAVGLGAYKRHSDEQRRRRVD